jgi:hypothetical protein
MYRPYSIATETHKFQVPRRRPFPIATVAEPIKFCLVVRQRNPFFGKSDTSHGPYFAYQVLHKELSGKLLYQDVTVWRKVL